MTLLGRDEPHAIDWAEGSSDSGPATFGAARAGGGVRIDADCGGLIRASAGGRGVSAGKGEQPRAGRGDPARAQDGWWRDTAHELARWFLFGRNAGAVAHERGMIGIAGGDRRSALASSASSDGFREERLRRYSEALAALKEGRKFLDECRLVEEVG